MIVEMKKYLIYGAKEQMDRFFSLAQKAGFLEFIGIWHKKALELPQQIKSILSAIRILRAWIGAECGIVRADESDPAVLSEKTVQLNNDLERYREEKRVLGAEIARIAPFGDFSKEDVRSLEKEGRRILQFFCLKSDLANEMTVPSELLWVATEYDLDYYVAVNEEKKHYPHMIEIQIDQPLGELHSRLKEVEARIFDLEAEMKCLAVHLPLLQEGLVDCLNAHHLESAKHDASYPLGSAVFAIEAWAPATRVKSLVDLLSGLAVNSEEIAIEPKDRVPTCMENRGIAKIGEDLVHIYDAPSIHDKDPSAWVLVFFSIFFAMIVSDAGYGLVYLALGLFLKWKFRQIGALGKRMIRLSLILSAACIIWGSATGSVFGMNLAPESFLRKFSLVDYLVRHKAEYVVREKNGYYQELLHRFPQISSATNSEDFFEKASIEQNGERKYAALEEFTDHVMMETAILMGIIHLSFSFGRSLRKHWSGAGWIAVMAGGYFYFPASILKTVTIVNFMGWISPLAALRLGGWLIAGGFLTAVFATLISHGVKNALSEVLHATKIFGDVLSYLRLYALGLAGALMASTFNELGSDFGTAIGIFVVLLGHLANLGISAMAGTIHGLRLNFLEWYHFCFEGGGKLFNPLQMKRPN